MDDAKIKEALELVFGANSDLYQNRGFQRRIGYGSRPAIINIDLANAWTRPGHAFTCVNCDEIIEATNRVLAPAAPSKSQSYSLRQPMLSPKARIPTWACGARKFRRKHSLLALRQ